MENDDKPQVKKHNLHTILTVLGLLILVGLIVNVDFIFNKQANFSNQSKAAEINKPKIQGQKISGYKEITLQSAPPKSVSLSSIAVFPSLTQQPNLPITGNWQGKTVKVVPDDRFFPSYNFFTYYGVSSMNTLQNNQMIIGGLSGFALKAPEDTEWQNLVLVPADQFLGLSGNVISKTLQVFDQQNTDTYVLGTTGLLRWQADGTLTEITDASRPGTHMSGMNDMVSYGNRGMATYYNDGSQWYLYYLEDGQMRKWLLPRPDPTTFSDTVSGMFFDPDDSTHQTIYALVNHCIPNGTHCDTAHGGQRINYLYQYHFSIDPGIPLDVIQLGTYSFVGQIHSQGYIYGMSMRHMSGQPTQKIVYGSYGPSAYRNGSDMVVFRNFDPQASSLQGHLIDARNPGGLFGQNTFDASTADTHWFSTTMGTVVGPYIGSGYETSDTAQYTYMTQPEKDMLANPYTFTSSSDSTGTVYIGHQYLHGQFRSALVTIFEQPLPTPTPIIYGPCDADINHDTRVNSTDFSILHREFGSACQPSDDFCADINHSGVVDVSDFVILRNNFGLECIKPTPTP